LYKRNQIEQAIAAALYPKLAELTPEFRTRIKRLLDTDRAFGRTPRSSDPELANYAFYSADPPGSGVEVWFSKYEAFAVLTGLRLMGHGWPQSFAVSVLRRVRPELERQHDRILKLDPKLLFDQEAIRRNAKEGDIAFNNTDPVLLTIVSKSGNALHEQNEPVDCSIHVGPHEATKWVSRTSKGGAPFTMFEIVDAAHALTGELAKTEPSRRGPGL
jgi:hypothetical protein